MALVVILLCSDEPSIALKYFFVGPFSSAYFFGDMLNTAVPLIICGLAASVSFSASVWNLGLEGMVYFGMLAGTMAAVAMEGWPAAVAVPLMFVAAFAGGALLAAICNFLKRKFDLDVMMSSLMLANVVFYLIFMLVEGPLRDMSSDQGVTTLAVPEAFRFTEILKPSDLNTTLFLALALAAVVYFALRRSRVGYEIRMTGLNPCSRATAESARLRRKPGHAAFRRFERRRRHDVCAHHIVSGTEPALRHRLERALHRHDQPQQSAAGRAGRAVLCVPHQGRGVRGAVCGHHAGRFPDHSGRDPAARHQRKADRISDRQFARLEKRVEKGGGQRMNEFVSGFLYTMIAYGTPLILCSLGGMMTGLSGRFNLGMEGMMLFAAFFSLYFANLWNSLLLGF
jgi:ABC-type uncharacterized transport system permease subunit